MYVVASIPTYDSFPTGNAPAYVSMYTNGKDVHIINGSDSSVVISFNAESAVKFARYILEKLSPDELVEAGKIQELEDQIAEMAEQGLETLAAVKEIKTLLNM